MLKIKNSITKISKKKRNKKIFIQLVALRTIANTKLINLEFFIFARAKKTRFFFFKNGLSQMGVRLENTRN